MQSRSLLEGTGRPRAGFTILAMAVGVIAVPVLSCGDSPTATPPPPPPPTPPPQPATVVVSPATAAVAPGAVVRLSAEVRDERGQVLAAAVAWASSDVSVASVDRSGGVRGVSEGSAMITATAGDAQGTAEITVADPDRAALVAFYEATDGPNWVNNGNWLTDAPLGEWYGVTTDASGRVVRLDLSGRWDDETKQFVGHGLTGSIPPALGGLAHLTRLNLAFNELSNSIPPELGGLASLTRLVLPGNSLTGPIPAELGDLGNLVRLDLALNNLTGAIPAELGDLAALTTLHLSSNLLSGPIPPELGDLANLVRLSVAQNDLTGPIPPELGNLAGLSTLELNDNRLTGPVPPELGDLGDLTRLSVGWNALTGPIPGSLLQLGRLESFYMSRNESLCVPGTAVFVAWIQRIENRDEEPVSCNAGDIAVLRSLFEATTGSRWRRSEGWLGDFALGGWHGVTADSLGRVTELDLSRNGLAGRLPPTLGGLVHLTDLRVGENAELSGRLPLSLSGLALQALHYGGTGLCAPASPSFRDWLGAIPSHEGSAAECGPLSDREILEALYEATAGADWFRNENWLADAPLGEWYGVEADEGGHVVSLDLRGNGLEGRIPPELGGLTNLRVLLIGRNALTGPIPRELGDLANLSSLWLDWNYLTGSIPPELEQLTDLLDLDLASNRLTGRIPPELGSLASLRWLNLSANRLTGPVPPDFAGLADLYSLQLDLNELSGPVPSELGNLARLRELYLGGNELAGPVPSAFGGLTGLRALGLQNNRDMSGALPASFSNLMSLETLQTGGTDLCAPRDAGFLGWLENVTNRWVALCDGEPAMAYLVQAVQSREFPIPLLAGERALLRVFPTAVRSTSAGIPRVRARFYLDGEEVHAADIPGKPAPVPTEVNEGSLATSANVEVPGWVIEPGLEMVVEIDPDGTLDPALGVTRRIPATGRAVLDVRGMPLFDLTLIPFVWTQTGDSSVVDLVREMAVDPENHELLEDTRTLLPVGALKVTAHEPVLSSSNDGDDLLRETEAIRVIQGGAGHYMGMMPWPLSGTPGVAFLSGKSSFSSPDDWSMAHELGHNLSLQHAPCGNAGGPDPAYPHADGTTGAWGYDFRYGGLAPPVLFDLMGYCPERRWISDYHFAKALRFRLAHEGTAAAGAAVVASDGSLLVWGGEDADGVPFLEPAFVVDAVPALPESSGEYRLAGRTASGVELFSLSFDMPEVADGDGSSSFAFALPARAGWEQALASITLTGPGGSVTLDGASDRPMAILRDPRTRQVRGFLRDLPPTTLTRAEAAAAVSPEPGLEVLFSRGIPDAEAWRK